MHGDDLRILGGSIRVAGGRRYLVRVSWVGNVDDLDSGARARTAPGADVREAVVRIHVGVEPARDVKRAGQPRPLPGCRSPTARTEPRCRGDDALLNGRAGGCPHSLLPRTG